MGNEMSRIIKATPKDMVIDVCAHSLGTCLVLETYMKNLKVEDRVRRTYLFNPVYTPFHHSGKTSEVSRLFEDNQDCRWFLNTGREPPLLHIGRNHAISQWTGRVALKHPKGFALATRTATPPAPQSYLQYL